MMMTPARSPDVIHCLLPSSRQPCAVRLAVVDIAAGSDPACGSDKPNAPTSAAPEVKAGTSAAFCASVPKRTMTSPTMLVTAIATDTDASARATSVMASE